MMNGPEKSDPAIVAGNPTNKAELIRAERRAGIKGNVGQSSTRRTQSIQLRRKLAVAFEPYPEFERC